MVLSSKIRHKVQWEQARYNEICGALRPFLIQSGFSMSKMTFVPVGAMQGVNLASRDGTEGAELWKWYQGPTLVDLLGKSPPSCRLAFLQ
jgi:elongation factor 1 alpha-like protein